MTYITADGYTYYRGTEQRHSRAPFLILACDQDQKLYAAVRKVALQQCGHFMIGTARIAGHLLTVSGAYGSDGLPEDYDRLPEPVRKKFIPVPDDVAQAYWHADQPGWNSSGSELPTLQAWACKEFLEG